MMYVGLVSMIMFAVFSIDPIDLRVSKFSVTFSSLGEIIGQDAFFGIMVLIGWLFSVFS